MKKPVINPKDFEFIIDKIPEDYQDDYGTDHCIMFRLKSFAKERSKFLTNAGIPTNENTIGWPDKNPEGIEDYFEKVGYYLENQSENQYNLFKFNYDDAKRILSSYGLTDVTKEWKENNPDNNWEY